MYKKYMEKLYCFKHLIGIDFLQSRQITYCNYQIIYFLTKGCDKWIDASPLKKGNSFQKKKYIYI